ncbi:MAG: hypothetical protein WBQ18_02320, partial [Solirubrobacteraceae bacterium]
MTGGSARGVIGLVAAATALLGGDAFAAGRVSPAAGLRAWLAVAAVAALGIALATVAAGVGVHARRRSRALRMLGGELQELLAVSDSPRESQELVVAHATRVVPGAGAAVLLVADGGERLACGPGDVADRDPLRGVLTGDVTPRGCLAVRLARGHSRHAGETPLGACAVCGTLDAEIACDPLVSAGEAIGSVLVAGLSPIGEDERAALRAAAATA